MEVMIVKVGKGNVFQLETRFSSTRVSTIVLL
jgi:hypothetical protein